MTSEARRVRIDLAYDGTAFEGWQIQARGRTVQGVLEEVLRRIQGGRRSAVRASGRTDSGAHARGQVVDALVATRLDDAALSASLSRMLPADVRPLSVRTVPASFHSQHLAVSKTYCYLVDRTPWGNPFLARFAWHNPVPLDRELLEEFLRRLPGRRDWSGFADSACEKEERVRDLTEASLADLPADVWAFTFTADGFLTRMVRNLVGTGFEIARGRFGIERLDEILETGSRALAGPTAPARGLCLERVRYPGEERETGPPPGVLLPHRV